MISLMPRRQAGRSSSRRIAGILSKAKRLAREYRHLTGRPLGVAGEVAEYEAARLLRLTLMPARTEGYDAVDPASGRRLEVKGRCLLPGHKPGQRMGRIDVRRKFDAVLLVLMDGNLNALEIYEAGRRRVINALTAPGSKARNERGSLGIARFKRIGRRIWQARRRRGVSYERITKRDLSRLGRIAAEDRADLFRRAPKNRVYTRRLFAVALCQGGALHYLDGNTGVKDFDVWSFYYAHSARKFPYRRRGQRDFGDAKFGIARGAPPDYVGRRVDLLGRSIPNQGYRDPVSALRGYLREGRTESARRLAQKAVILIEPARLLGTVVWPEISERC